ncbi:MAG: nucleoside 2-deoxyribosyltransferase [Oryzomonas sp.]|uniref:nucleoside 2-deoxyribosyltransferase n=1 Tax=Oryzomonas sp. TaxID=2855186 RepID=UPI00284B382D|nr:nucleoside 2-deoxyribosyltransferase [Oryzomonas sp.]MDR3581042.1 nucleoside 2-deoxyribosyltransferase [Oryzomonas sp.]
MAEQSRAYLAGPDVFLPNPLEMALNKKSLCTEFGIEGVFPLDAALNLSELSKMEQGYLISKENEKLIRTCQLVIANLTPFRGPSADVGTVYEVGFARALGLPIFGYTNISTPYNDRAIEFLGQNIIKTRNMITDAMNMHIESFDLRDNLMIDGGIRHSGGKFCATDSPPENLFTDLSAFKECLFAASEYFAREKGWDRSTEMDVSA